MNFIIITFLEAFESTVLYDYALCKFVNIFDEIAVEACIFAWFVFTTK